MYTARMSGLIKMSFGWLTRGSKVPCARCGSRSVCRKGTYQPIVTYLCMSRFCQEMWHLPLRRMMFWQITLSLYLSSTAGNFTGFLFIFVKPRQCLPWYSVHCDPVLLKLTTWAAQAMNVNGNALFSFSLSQWPALPLWCGVVQPPVTLYVTLWVGYNPDVLFQLFLLCRRCLVF